MKLAELPWSATSFANDESLTLTLGQSLMMHRFLLADMEPASVTETELGEAEIAAIQAAINLAGETNSIVRHEKGFC